MNIKDTFYFTTIHTLIKIVSGVIMNKIIAIYLGPSGLAMIGQFQNFISIISSISNGSVQTGLLTQTATFNNDVEKQKETWFNALLISICCSIFVSIFITVFSEWFSEKILFSSEYKILFLVFGFSVIFYSLNLFVLSILNGLGNIKLYTIINILISISTLILVSSLTIFFNLKGSIIGLILAQSIVFIISYVIIFKTYHHSFFVVNIAFLSLNKLKTLLAYGMTTFSSGLITSLAYIVIRTTIVSDTSIEIAGLWEGAIKIGLYFNLFFSLPLSIYLLPKFSETKSIEIIVDLLKKSMKFVLPLMVIGIMIFYIWCKFFIILLFDKSFLQIQDFIIFIFFAEIFRVLNNLFINLLMAKNKLLISLCFEFIFYGTFVVFVFSMFDSCGLKGISVIYCLVSIFTFIIYCIYFNKEFLLKIKESNFEK